MEIRCTSRIVEMLLAELTICCLALVVVQAQAEEEVLVEIPQGSLKGLKTVTVRKQMPLYSFKGIPYAKPNVGRDRFEVAQSPEPWTGLYDATKHRSTCMFYCIMRQKLMGDDDCLFINVYTPEVNKDARKAVMVWFHGGGFNMGSGDDDLFGPDFLIEQDVVLVTMNYRLGATGFLSTGDANAPGNVGLKDQVQALKWVQENIYHFGGCSHRVTIFGQSAGAASVQYHMLSPMSQGLFNYAITESGSAISPWSITYKPKELAFKLGVALGIETTDTAELMDKLKDTPTGKLIEASQAVNELENNMNGHMHAFIPAVEADVGQEIFLTADPWEMVKRGKVADVPYLAGLNADEAIFMKFALEQADLINENFEYMLPDDLNITDPAQRKEIAASVKKFYFGDKAVSKDTVQEYSDLMSDLMFVIGTDMSLRIMNSRNSESIYYYLFTYDAPFGVMKNLFNVERGVTHSDELGYIFYANAIGKIPQPGSPAEKITNTFTKMWTNFAKTGNPTSDLDDDVTVNWEPMGKEGNYLTIDQTLKMDKHMFKERIDFWVNIYKDILGDRTNLF